MELYKLIVDNVIHCSTEKVTAEVLCAEDKQNNFHLFSENMRGKQDTSYRKSLDKILFALCHFTQNRRFSQVRFSGRLTSVENSLSSS